MDFSSNPNESFSNDKQAKRQLFACVKKYENRSELLTTLNFSLPHLQVEKNLIAKKRNRIGLMKNSSSFREGRWDSDEHERFLKACYDHGEDWNKIEEAIQTRNIVQIRSHAQKYIIKLCKKYSIKLNKKKFKNRKSVHLEWNEKDENQKKLDINKMNKYDRNILKMFSYYDRDYTRAIIGSVNSVEQIMAFENDYACEENKHIQDLEKYEKFKNYVNILNSYSNSEFDNLKTQENLEILKNSQNLDNPSGPSSTTVEENILSKNNKNYFNKNYYSQSKFVKFSVLRNNLLKEDLTCHPCISKLTNTSNILYKNKIFKTFSDIDSMNNNYTLTNENISNKEYDKSKINENTNLSISYSDENLDHTPKTLNKKTVSISKELSSTNCADIGPYSPNSCLMPDGMPSSYIKNFFRFNKTEFPGISFIQKTYMELFDILNSNISFQRKLFTSEYDSNLSNLYDLFPILFDNSSSCKIKKVINSFKNECLNGIYHLSKIDKNLNQLYISHNDNIKKLYEESLKKQRNYVLSMINKSFEFNKM